MKKFKVSNEIELRELSTDDIMPIFTTINTQREYLGEWLPFVEYTQKPEDTAEFVVTALKRMEITGELTTSIYYNNEFAGTIGFKDTDFANKRTEIGYWLSYNFQHNGVMTQCCKTLIKYAFDELNINRIQIKVAKGNIQSMHIPERLGFIYEGTERDGELLTGGFTDVNVYSLLKRDSTIAG